MLLSAPKLGEYLGISTRSARRWIASGRVPVYRDGRPKVRQEDVDAYLETVRTDPEPVPERPLKGLVAAAVERAKARKTIGGAA